MNLKKLFGVILLSTILNNAVAKDVDLKILVPFPAGGAQDVVARIVSTGASKLGYTSLVENKPGAGGMTGTNECIKRTATEKNLLCMVSPAQALVIPPELEQFVQFKFEDLQFVKLVARSPIVLITSPKNTKSYNEIINDFKSNAKTNFGSSSWLTTQHNNHFLKNLGNTNSQVVDYKGGNQVVIDVIGGTLDYSFIPYSAVMSQYLGGTVRIVGVSPTRADIPTLAKIPTIDIKDGWTEHNSGDFGFVVGPQARKQDIDNIEKMLNEILTDKSVVENLQKIGSTSDASSRDSYRKMSTDFRNRVNTFLKK
jgi:tripartite-type tricarboxylate transporter receptor subunit TctC